MRTANKGTQLKGGEPKHAKPPAKSPQTGKNEGNAKDDPQELAANQAKLGVGPDHKTPAMKRGKRGTFP